MGSISELWLNYVLHFVWKRMALTQATEGGAADISKALETETIARQTMEGEKKHHYEKTQESVDAMKAKSESQLKQIINMRRQLGLTG